MRRLLPKIVLSLAALVLSLWQSHAALAQERVALVIGNSAYTAQSVLANPANDADDIAASLKRLGFAVTVSNNASADRMRRALRDFGRLAQRSEIALVYYAGHGIEVGGENWLIPTDAELKTDGDAEHEAIGLKSVMTTVEGATKLGLVILDACRDNPFAKTMKRSIRTRTVARGLAAVEPSGNVLVAYASREGTVADDGQGRNSPFTQALLRHIETPGMEINFLFRNVRDDVMQTTRRAQQPFVYGSLSRDQIFLKEGGAQAPRPVATPPQPVATPQAPASTQQAALIQQPVTGRRIALVIGMSAYQHVTKLNNPKNDVVAASEALRKADFAQVRTLNDLTRAQMIAALDDFATEAASAEVALIYFAGHGARLGAENENYLVPVDAKLADVSDLRKDAVSLTQLVLTARNARQLGIVVVDADQADPAASSTTGLTAPRMPAPSGAPVVVFYAASPGENAFDGTGTVSPFTASFAQRIATPGLDLDGVVKAVRQDVTRATDNKQTPVLHGTMPGRKFMFSASR